MNVELDYGRGQLRVVLPDHCEPTVIRKRPMTPLSDPEAAVREALANPVDALPLRQLARGKRSACILICDFTRPVPNRLFLREMAEQCMAAGIERTNITVLVATGLHRPNDGDELAELVSDPWVLENLRVENHFARDATAHVDLGVTPGRRVPVKLDRRFVEAELRIATGLVEPHFMAGYSGGRKVVAPGVAHEDTIRTFHSARFMEDPAAIQCNLRGNPLHEEQLAIVRMLGDVYALNTVLDERRRLVHVSFGEIVASHLKAVTFVQAAIEVEIPRQFKTVLTSAAGYPLDKTYYQTVKGMVTPMAILDEGADLIIASDCSEGLGSAEYRAAQERLVKLGPKAFLDSILPKRLADIDEWQTEMQLKPMRRARIHLYSKGLPYADHRLTGVESTDSMEESLAASIAKSGDPAIAVIPEGPYVVPVLRG